MGLLDRFKKKEKNGDAAGRGGAAELEIYSGMRVEVTAPDGRMLFVAKLENPEGGRAELYQYTEAAVSKDTEALRVNIRGYHDGERKAVYMEGVITPMPQHVWQVEDLVVARIGNDRAFFRLDADIEATATTLGGLNAGEKPCRLLNISVGGARIGSEHVYHEGDKFLLKVKLMEDRDVSTLFCQVLRVIDKGDSKFEYGCQFLGLNNTEEARITQNIFAAQRKKRGAF